MKPTEGLQNSKFSNATPSKRIWKPLLAIAIAVGSATQVQAETALWTVGDAFARPESIAYDAKNKVLYVTNINGKPAAKDGNGYISKLSADGKLINKTWIGGLDAPKGAALFKGKLYVADIDRIVEIDLKTATVLGRHNAPNAKFLNDVAIAPDGAVFASDTRGHAIYRLEKREVSVWLAKGVTSPNGLLVRDGELLVMSAPHPGKGANKNRVIQAVSLSSKKIRQPMGGLTGAVYDGIQVDAAGRHYVSDWLNGVVVRVSPQGKPATILRLSKGLADIALIEDSEILVVPRMFDNRVEAYRLPR